MPSDSPDSGMESVPTTESKEGSPKKHDLSLEEDFDEDELLDETLGERLWGLTEMFPEVVRNGIWAVSTGLTSGAKNLYHYSRAAAWIFFSSSAILVAPIVFEMERAQVEEMQKQQQRQILLGPNAAVSGNRSPMGMIPGTPGA